MDNLIGALGVLAALFALVHLIRFLNLPVNGRRKPMLMKREKKAILYRRQGGRCNGCDERLPKRRLQVDHIVPVKHGGHNRLSNLQLLCPRCNGIKGTKSMDHLLGRLEREREERTAR